MLIKKTIVLLIASCLLLTGCADSQKDSGVNEVLSDANNSKVVENFDTGSTEQSEETHIITPLPDTTILNLWNWCTMLFVILSRLWSRNGQKVVLMSKEQKSCLVAIPFATIPPTSLLPSIVKMMRLKNNSQSKQVSILPDLAL